MEQSKTILISPREHFDELVGHAFGEFKINTHPHVKVYLVDLLEHYLDARNLEDQNTTLAEMYLTAGQLPQVQKISLLKKLGDRALYISGFFGDSLQRKIVDIDYYAEMGCSAYYTLSKSVSDDLSAKIYNTIGSRFGEFVDVLGLISDRSMFNQEESLLRTYEKYLKTGSEYAKTKLIDQGVIIPQNQSKITKL